MQKLRPKCPNGVNSPSFYSSLPITTFDHTQISLLPVPKFQPASGKPRPRAGVLKFINPSDLPASTGFRNWLLEQRLKESNFLEIGLKLRTSSQASRPYHYQHKWSSCCSQDGLAFMGLGQHNKVSWRSPLDCCRLHHRRGSIGQIPRCPFQQTRWGGIS